MGIPEISRVNVLGAIERIQREGVPASRRSTRYYLVHKGLRYPPKYVVSLAVYDATGQELDPKEFSGGAETNSLLRRLGFSVVAFSADAVDRGDDQSRSVVPPFVRKKLPGKTEAKPASSWTVSQEPLIGRVVVRGQPGDPTEGERMLLEVLKNRWPHGLHLKFLLTPGGFVVAPFPPTLPVTMSWDSRHCDLKALIQHAEDMLSITLTERVRKAAEEKIDVLTVGIDLSNVDCSEHAELVAICEISKRRIYWTGKSYPTSGQERNLVQVADLNTHLLTVSDERVLVLGCHDLNMFSPRSRANQARGSNRWKRSNEMRRLACRFQPTIVLQHPHSTDSPYIWRTAWSGLVRELGGLKAWASGIAYFSRKGTPRGSLDKVLAATQGGTPTVDFVTVDPQKL